MRGLRECGIDLPNRLGVRRDEVERPVVEARPQHQLHDRGGDEVHRNHVGVAEFRDGHRQRGRQLREGGERGEEVVGAVHLVHLAGDRAPDHSCWTIDPPRNAGGAHQPLGLELGAVVRRREVLAEVEVVLGEPAGVIAGHRDGRDVVQRRTESRGEVDHRPGAVDVGRRLLLARGEVVDRAEMQHVVGGRWRGPQPEPRRGEVADECVDPARSGQRSADRSNFDSEPGRTRTCTCADGSRSSSRSIVCLPRNPVPPVTMYVAIPRNLL